jgi:integrase
LTSSVETTRLSYIEATPQGDDGELDADEEALAGVSDALQISSTAEATVYLRQLSDAIDDLPPDEREAGKVRSVYVIHNEHGQPYTAHGIATLFNRACIRAKVEDVTLRDIRAKAATDAKKHGYADAQLQVALAHTDAATTRDYIRTREVPVSEVRLRLPKKKY